MGQKTARARRPKKRPQKCREGSVTNEIGIAADTGRREKSSAAANVVIGARFKMSLLGSMRNKRLAGKEGLVVGNSRINRSIRVLFDGRRTPMSLHPDYIELITLESE